MWSFAWRNLLTRPLRTILGLVGLSVPILGFIGLFSLSEGVSNVVDNTLNQIQGVMVQRSNTPSPVFSDLPAEYVRKIEALPGVRAVAPEVWAVAPPIDGRGLFMKSLTSGNSQSLLKLLVVCGQDIEAHRKLVSAIYPRYLLPPSEGGGRYLNPSDIGKNRIVISDKIARDYPDKKTGEPRKVGEQMNLGLEKFEIIGIYSTKSFLLDVAIIMDIGTARRLLKVPEEQVSSIFVEGDPGSANTPEASEAFAQLIEEALPNTDARTMEEYMGTFRMAQNNLNAYLWGICLLALLVGVVGIINTMLMSTTERFAEFGVLRTNGWSRVNVLALVTTESAYIGAIAGIIACVLAYIASGLANALLAEYLEVPTPPWLYLMALGISTGVAVLGGLYPAAQAARMAPMEAIRLGSR